MENTISTNVVKLDLATILANYKKPEFWSKKWTIIDTKWLTVVWYMSQINCENNTISSYVRVSKINYKKGNILVNDFWWYPRESCMSIPTNNKEYTQSLFEKNIYGALIRLINYTESLITGHYKEYKLAMQQDSDFIENLRRIAINFLDEKGVTNLSVRNVYIDSYVRAQSAGREDYTQQVIKNYENKVLTDVLVYAAAWFNNEDDFVKFSQANRKRKSIYNKVKKEIKLLQSEDWKNSMKNKLGDI